MLDIPLRVFALFCVRRTNSSPRPAVRGDRFQSEWKPREGPMIGLDSGGPAVLGPEAL